VAPLPAAPASGEAPAAPLTPASGLAENFVASRGGAHAKQAPADATKMAIPTTFLTVLRHLGYERNCRLAPRDSQAGLLMLRP